MPFEREVAARYRGTCPQCLDQLPIQTARAQQTTLEKHLAALFVERPARRDEYDLAVGVSGLACRRLGDVDGPARDMGGKESKPVRVLRI